MPYGVQHGSDKRSGSLTRSALPIVKVLKPGGVIVLAWNLFLIPRAEMEAAFTANGLSLPEDKMNFVHRVDQAIERDVIVGLKT